MSAPGWRPADWPAPSGVHLGTSLRTGGVSVGALAEQNLGANVGDDPTAVATNRARLASALSLPVEPLWLAQVHGSTVVRDEGQGGTPTADAAVAFAPGRVLAVLTADCLPVALASRDGTRVGLAHAGWRGLAAGVVEATVAALGVPGRDLLAWLGPAIGPQAFEVGGEVREAFRAQDPGADAAFVPNARGRWQADLYALARRRLAALSVESVSGGGECTFTQADKYFSYRRDPRAGRMVTLLWREAPG